ncbi:hypothetical protein ACLB2K_036318 [Fragaria x ananassa]
MILNVKSIAELYWESQDESSRSNSSGSSKVRDVIVFDYIWRERTPWQCYKLMSVYTVHQISRTKTPFHTSHS